MFKKIVVALIAVFMLLSCAACGTEKTLHCDKCNAEIAVDEDSNMNESWIVYCKDCEKELGLDEF